MQTNNILFRSSSVGGLLTEAKSKTEYYLGDVKLTTAKANKIIDKAIESNDFTELFKLTYKVIEADSSTLSDTAKTLVEDLWLYNTYGFRESIKNDYMDKGVEMEQESMQLAQDVLGGAFRSRYNQQLSNDYISGCPDIVLTDCVEDIKTSWNLKTYFNAEPTTMYTTQAQCYMWLTGVHSYRLIYALVPTPQDIISSQMQKLSYAYGGNYDNLDYIAECQQIQRNNDLINEIPKADRVKVFEFTYDEAVIEKLKGQIEKARNYYNTLKLK
jgi:hypothetical protein